MGVVIKSSDLKGAAAGMHTTVAADDDVSTGLRNVKYAMATLHSAPVIGAAYVTVEIPDQSVSPGVISIKTWKPTGAGDTAVLAATTFSRVVNWVAFGL